MEAGGQVRSVYLTLSYSCTDGKVGAVLHEIQITKDGKSLIKCTENKPALPDRQLFDHTQLPIRPFISCERIGSKLYLFAGHDFSPFVAVPTSAYVFDAKSSAELVQFHDLPTYTKGNPLFLIAAHGSLYHLATGFNRSGVPIPFEVYEPSTKSWDLLPPVPQCPFVPHHKFRREYMGYAVWGTCILVSLAYRTLNQRFMISVPVLFNVESTTWHQVKVTVPLGHFFPWRDKAVVIGDTAYALGYKMGSIISFSINKSGSEEDGSLVYSLKRPYILAGLNIFPHPVHSPHEPRLQQLTPLGEFEFCLVQTICYPSSGCQPFWITTFKIIPKKGTFSKIHTLHSTVLYMSTQDYGPLTHFSLRFCYNPDYEHKEVVLTTTKDIRTERNRTRVSSQEVNSDALRVRKICDHMEKNLLKRASWHRARSDDTKAPVPMTPISAERVHGFVSDSHRVKSSTLPILPVDIGKVDMEEETSRYNDACLKPEIELRRKGSAEIKGENSPDMVESNSWDFEPNGKNSFFLLTKEKVDMLDLSFEADCCPDSISNASVLKSKKARRRKRKVKCSKKKGSEGNKRDYIIRFGPLFIALFAGILLFPEIRDALCSLLSWEMRMKFGLLELLGLESWG